MPFFINKIAGSILKEYILTSKFCKITNDFCLIEGKFGSLSLDFSKYTDVNNCQLKFKRLSGNGLVSIVIDNNYTNYNIVSKISEKIDVALHGTSKVVNIVRPSSGIGNISLLEVSLTSEMSLGKMDIDIKAILNSCTTKGIRIISRRAFAEEGSVLNTNGIKTIETNPPNMYKIKNNSIYFLGKCEIINLDIVGNKTYQTPLLLQHINNASMMAQNIPSLKKDDSTFDFTPLDGKIISNNDVKIIDSGLSAGRYSLINIPDLSLLPNTNYVLTIYGKNLNGNGRVSVAINNSNLNNRVEYFNNDTYITIPFITNKNGPYEVNISRKGPSTGTIWISKFSVTSDKNYYDSVTSFTPGFSPGNIKDITYDISIDYFRQEIINYAKISAETYATYFDDSINLNLKPITHSMHNWVSKFINLFKNVTVDSLILDNCNKEKASDDSILLTDINNLLNYKFIMLEEFVAKPTVSQLNILQSADAIFTPSLPNAQYLRSINAKNVMYVPKFWPYKAVSSKIFDSYNLLFARNIKNTIEVVQRYKLNKQMVVVGYRGNDLGVKTFSEYLPYDQLLSLIYHADCIIDLPENIHYYSGLLDFLFIAKKNIITTNHWLSVSKPETHIVKSIIKDGKLLPNYDDIIYKLNSIQENNQCNYNMEYYNFNIKSSLMLMSEALNG